MAGCSAMDMGRHLELVRAEGERMAAIPADALGAPIPTVDGWTVENAVRHTGKVHQWVTGALRLAPGQDMGDIGELAGIPKGPDCLAAYREALDGMLAAFDEREADDPVVNFAGVGTAGWWARRQAAEVAIHRTDSYDGVHAAGGPVPDPIAVDGAADGVDEWASFFVAVRFPQRFGELPAVLNGRSIHIHGTDDPAPPDGAEWHLSFADGAVAVEHAHAKGDVAVRGSAADLFLTVWRRRPLSTVEIIGDESVATTLLDACRF